MSVKRKGQIRTSRKRRKQNRNAVIAVVVVALAVVLAGMLGGSLYAKYIRSRTDNERAEAADFYFNSNLLTTSGASYTYPADTTSISFAVYNYEDNLRTSECDITYEVTLVDTNTGGTVVSQTLANATVTGGTVSSGTATLTKDVQSTHTITFSGLSAGTYTVTAKAAAPYSATLTATFTLPATSSGISVSVSDEGANVKVTVTVNQGGVVVLTWPNGVIPDTTKSIFTGATINYTDPANTYGGGSVTVTFTNDGSYTFNFLKQYTTSTYDNTSGFTAVYSQ